MIGQAPQPSESVLVLVTKVARVEGEIPLVQGILLSGQDLRGEEALVGRLGAVIALGAPRTVADFLHELGGRLEEVYVEADERIAPS